MFWRRKKAIQINQNNTSIIKEMQSNTSNIQMEYLMLQSQINPHFLYNTLDSIRSEALKSKQTIIAEMIECLSKFFRYCISSRGNFVRLSEELNHVNDYFFIQKFRFEERIALLVDIENSDVLNYYIPKMTLQPIIENAIVHGLEEKIEPGKIHISINSTEGKMYITISDNGIGMSEKKLYELNNKLIRYSSQVEQDGTNKSGIALTNVNMRIQLCYGKTYGLRVRSIKGEGTQVHIILPLVDDFSLGQYKADNNGGQT